MQDGAAVCGSSYPTWWPYTQTEDESRSATPKVSCHYFLWLSL